MHARKHTLLTKRVRRASYVGGCDVMWIITVESVAWLVFRVETREYPLQVQPTADVVS
jgi:hypothetical protein